MKYSPCTIKATWKGDDGKTYRFRREGNPRLTITITHFMCQGASHWYCRVKGQMPSIYCLDNRRTYHMGGYGDGAPNMYQLDFDAIRVLDKLELDLIGEPIGKIGQETTRYNSLYEALAEGIKVAQDNFRDTPTKHWRVRFEGVDHVLDCCDYQLHEITDFAERYR